MKTFPNELGNEITIQVVEKVINGVDGVQISIAGPTSDTEVHITRLEAKVLLEQLSTVLHSSAMVLE